MFFNAISVALAGNEELAEHSLNDDLSAICQNGGWSSFRAFVAVSSILQRPIESIYPSANGHTDQVCRLLNRKVSQTSAAENQDPPLRILWSRTQASDATVWIPNHFVPVVALTAQADKTHLQWLVPVETISNVSMDSSVDVKTDAADDNMSYVSQPSDIDFRRNGQHNAWVTTRLFILRQWRVPSPTLPCLWTAWRSYQME